MNRYCFPLFCTQNFHCRLEIKFFTAHLNVLIVKYQAFNEANAPTTPFTLLLQQRNYNYGLEAVEDQKLINRKTNEEFSLRKLGEYRYLLGEYQYVFDGFEIKRGAKKNAN